MKHRKKNGVCVQCGRRDNRMCPGLIGGLANVAAVALFAVFLSGCTLVTELADSSGCMWTTGGPLGVASGEVLVCRSGKDNASVTYKDDKRSIEIVHD